MKRFVSAAVAAVVIGTGAQSVAAAGLGVMTELPEIWADSAMVNYSVLPNSTGDLSTFDATVSYTDGVVLPTLSYVQFGFGHDVVDPAQDISGGFSVYDDAFDNYLSGDLLAMGYEENKIELLFDAIVGLAAGSFGEQVLMTIEFDDLDPTQMGDIPFASFADAMSYDAKVYIANVVQAPAIPLPAGFPLLLSSAAGLVWLRSRKNS